MHLNLPDLRLVLVTAGCATAASLTLALATPPTLAVDGQRVATDVAPVTTAGGTYLPIRAVAEASGADTAYDRAGGTITVRRGGQRLVMRLGSTVATLDGKPVTLAHAPFVVQGRTMVGATAIANALGSSVRYDRKHARLDVRTPGVVVAGAPDDEL